MPLTPEEESKRRKEAAKNAALKAQSAGHGLKPGPKKPFVQDTRGKSQQELKDEQKAFGKRAAASAATAASMGSWSKQAKEQHNAKIQEYVDEKTKGQGPSSPKRKS